jgi:hypothetical protein
VKVRFALAVGIVFALLLTGTAIAGRRGATKREALIRAQVWCDALIKRDPLRYQDTFRRGFFRGRFDRFANLYREPSEGSILAQMPHTTECRVVGGPLPRRATEDVLVRVVRRGPDADAQLVDLRMQKEAGFWVVWQVIELE